MILGGNAQKRPFGFAVWICGVDLQTEFRLSAATAGPF